MQTLNNFTLVIVNFPTHPVEFEETMVKIKGKTQSLVVSCWSRHINKCVALLALALATTVSKYFVSPLNMIYFHLLNNWYRFLKMYRGYKGWTSNSYDLLPLLSERQLQLSEPL